jgi:hypothetical protein
MRPKRTRKRRENRVVQTGAISALCTTHPEGVKMATKTATKKRRKQAVKTTSKTERGEGLGRGQIYTLASCLECSVLIAWGSVTGAHDIPIHWRDEAREKAGEWASLRQGFGIKNGGIHLCPPTRTLEVEVIF